MDEVISQVDSCGITRCSCICKWKPSACPASDNLYTFLSSHTSGSDSMSSMDTLLLSDKTVDTTHTVHTEA